MADYDVVSKKKIRILKERIIHTDALLSMSSHLMTENENLKAVSAKYFKYLEFYVTKFFQESKKVKELEQILFQKNKLIEEHEIEMNEMRLNCEQDKQLIEVYKRELSETTKNENENKEAIIYVLRVYLKLLISIQKNIPKDVRTQVMLYLGDNRLRVLVKQLEELEKNGTKKTVKKIHNPCDSGNDSASYAESLSSVSSVVTLSDQDDSVQNLESKEIITTETNSNDYLDYSDTNGCDEQILKSGEESPPTITQDVFDISNGIPEVTEAIVTTDPQGNSFVIEDLTEPSNTILENSSCGNREMSLIFSLDSQEVGHLPALNCDYIEIEPSLNLENIPTSNGVLNEPMNSLDVITISSQTATENQPLAVLISPLGEQTYYSELPDISFSEPCTITTENIYSKYQNNSEITSENTVNSNIPDVSVSEPCRTFQSTHTNNIESTKCLEMPDISLHNLYSKSLPYSEKSTDIPLDNNKCNLEAESNISKCVNTQVYSENLHKIFPQNEAFTSIFDFSNVSSETTTENINSEQLQLESLDVIFSENTEISISSDTPNITLSEPCQAVTEQVILKQIIPEKLVSDNMVEDLMISSKSSESTNSSDIQHNLLSENKAKRKISPKDTKSSSNFDIMDTNLSEQCNIIRETTKIGISEPKTLYPEDFNLNNVESTRNTNISDALSESNEMDIDQISLKHHVNPRRTYSKKSNIIHTKNNKFTSSFGTEPSKMENLNLKSLNITNFEISSTSMTKLCLEEVQKNTIDTEAQSFKSPEIEHDNKITESIISPHNKSSEFTPSFNLFEEPFSIILEDDIQQPYFENFSTNFDNIRLSEPCKAIVENNSIKPQIYAEKICSENLKKPQKNQLSMFSDTSFKPNSNTSTENSNFITNSAIKDVPLPKPCNAVTKNDNSNCINDSKDGNDQNLNAFIKEPSDSDIPCKVVSENNLNTELLSQNVNNSSPINTEITKISDNSYVSFLESCETRHKNLEQFNNPGSKYLTETAPESIEFVLNDSLSEQCIENSPEKTNVQNFDGTDISQNNIECTINSDISEPCQVEIEHKNFENNIEYTISSDISEPCQVEMEHNNFEQPIPASKSLIEIPPEMIKLATNSDNSSASLSKKCNMATENTNSKDTNYSEFQNDQNLNKNASETNQFTTGFNIPDICLSVPYKKALENHFNTEKPHSKILNKTSPKHTELTKSSDIGLFEQCNMATATEVSKHSSTVKGISEKEISSEQKEFNANSDRKDNGLETITENVRSENEKLPSKEKLNYSWKQQPRPQSKSNENLVVNNNLKSVIKDLLKPKLQTFEDVPVRNVDSKIDHSKVMKVLSIEEILVEMCCFKDIELISPPLSPVKPRRSSNKKENLKRLPDIMGTPPGKNSSSKINRTDEKQNSGTQSEEPFSDGIVMKDKVLSGIKCIQNSIQKSPPTISTDVYPCNSTGKRKLLDEFERCTKYSKVETVNSSFTNKKSNKVTRKKKTHELFGNDSSDSEIECDNQKMIDGSKAEYLDKTNSAVIHTSFDKEETSTFIPVDSNEINAVNDLELQPSKIDNELILEPKIFKDLPPDEINGTLELLVETTAVEKSPIIQKSNNNLSSLWNTFKAFAKYRNACEIKEKSDNSTGFIGSRESKSPELDHHKAFNTIVENDSNQSLAVGNTSENELHVIKSMENIRDSPNTDYCENQILDLSSVRGNSIDYEIPQLSFYEATEEPLNLSLKNENVDNDGEKRAKTTVPLGNTNSFKLSPANDCFGILCSGKISKNEICDIKLKSNGKEWAKLEDEKETNQTITIDTLGNKECLLDKPKETNLVNNSLSPNDPVSRPSQPQSIGFQMYQQLWCHNSKSAASTSGNLFKQNTSTARSTNKSNLKRNKETESAQCIAAACTALNTYIKAINTTPEEARNCVEQCFAVLNSLPNQYVSEAIVSIVLENVDEEVVLEYTPPAPPLTPTLHRICVLISLSKRKETLFKPLIDRMRDYIYPDTRFWPDDTIISCTRFFTALCIAFNCSAQCVGLCLDAVTRMPQRGSLVINTVLLTWPDVLPEADYTPFGSCAYTFALLLIQTPLPKRPQQKRVLLNLKTMLNRFYGYKMDDPIEIYTKKLIEHLKENHSLESINKSFELLSRSKNWKWSSEKIVSPIVQRLNDFWGVDSNITDAYAKTALDICVRVMHWYPRNDEESYNFVRNIADILRVILLSQKVSSEGEELIVNAFIQLHNIIRFDKIIKGWIPRQAVKPELAEAIGRCASAAKHLPNFIRKNNPQNNLSISTKSSRKNKKKKKKALAFASNSEGHNNICKNRKFVKPK